MSSYQAAEKTAICFVTAENPGPHVYQNTLQAWIFFVPRISPFFQQPEHFEFIDSQL